jgi:hypothetical protein
MFKALAFLLVRTTANRFSAQIKRIRQPRYALGFAAVAAYFWLILLSPDRYDNGGNPLSFLVSSSGRTLVTAGVFLLFASSWFSGKRGTLAWSNSMPDRRPVAGLRGPAKISSPHRSRIAGGT